MNADATPSATCALTHHWNDFYHTAAVQCSCPLQVVGLLQDDESIIQAALTARPNVTAFAYFSSAINPVLYVFAGSSHIRQAGLSFMGKLFEATNSESRTTSTFTRSGRGSSSRDEGGARLALSVKLARTFKGKNAERSDSTAGSGGNEPEIRTLTNEEPLE